VVLNHQSDGFGVCIGGEFNASRIEMSAQIAKILDDAIVDNGDPSGQMGVGVVFVRRTVRGPTGVANARLASKRFMHQSIRQIHQFSNRTTAI
jgi:hypothetical protein